MTDPLALIRARSLADCTPDERVLLAEIDRLRGAIPCTCGSGAHPRRCEAHPAAYDRHCRELAREQEMEAEIDRLRRANTAMHRRAQRAEGIADRCAADRPQGAQSRSVGRALANYAAARERVRAEEWRRVAEDSEAARIRLAEELREAQARAERAESRNEHTGYWYGCRWERLRDLLRGTEYESRAVQIMANGTVHEMPDGTVMYEPPTYAQRYNLMRHRMERAEEHVATLQRCLGQRAPDEPESFATAVGAAMREGIAQARSAAIEECIAEVESWQPLPPRGVLRPSREQSARYDGALSLWRSVLDTLHAILEPATPPADTPRT